MTWAHFNPVRIVAGLGGVARLENYLSDNGVALLVCSVGSVCRGLPESIEKLINSGRLCVYAEVTPNPELDFLDIATQSLRLKGITEIIAIGGGSVIDAAKVLSVTIPSEFDKPLNQVLRQKASNNWSNALSVIAIPTTSGTGAEVTPFATVWDASTHKKHSITGELIYPTHALLDPELTLTLTPNATLFPALDTISHALESLWNINRTPVSQAYAMQALYFAVNSLPVVLSQPGNIEHRYNMQQASLLSGMAISQTRTAIAHSISYPLTSHFNMPHGLACSFTLYEILKENMDKNNIGFYGRGLFNSVLDLLRSLDLPRQVKKYASVQDILNLRDEMYTKGRSDNYSGQLIGGIDSLIKKALD